MIDNFFKNIEIVKFITTALKCILNLVKFANFTGLYFLPFTTFRNQTLQFY